MTVSKAVTAFRAEQTGRKKKWTNDAIMAAFVRLATEVGHTPYLHQFTVHANGGSLPTPSTIISAYGSYKALCRAAGHTPRPAGKAKKASHPSSRETLAVSAYWKGIRAARQKVKPGDRIVGRATARRQGAKTNGGSPPKPDDLRDWRDLTWELGMMASSRPEYKRQIVEAEREYDRAINAPTKNTGRPRKNFTVGKAPARKAA